MSNKSAVSQFLLLGFSDIRELQILSFGFFLVIYMATLISNILVFTVIATGHHVHNPMYFFLMNLSIIDISSISITLPKAMANSLLNTRLISYNECAAQLFFFSFLYSEVIILTIMAYDRYIAICDPLNYGRVMNRRFCFQMAMGAWMSGLLYGIVNVTSTFANTFCSTVINQFFCEIPHLLRLSCPSNLFLIESAFLILGACIGTCCLCFIVASYVHIFRTVLGITSVEGKRKAFSTCIPHLIVVSLFLTFGMVAHLKPAFSSPSNWDLALSLMYTVVPPTLNPIIYTIRNKEIKAEISKVFWRAVHVNRKMADF